ncbi:gp436 family protein [Veronia pacifica]|uniref:Mu-like prophage protein gp36 n=1 Tax=Veronia pacifica TaxID=1080227 RepID=A0A1C3ELB8_9GAMM|nr:DUF1320 domain-containing protein [Veronia pacifica]ODA34015.1 hypothetical protein A8L45_08185 [Veronia pacifica]
MPGDIVTGYATVNDILTRYGEDVLFTLAHHEGELDEPAVVRSLTDASGLIDSYLGSRYPLPLNDTPQVLTRLTIDIALYWLSEDGGGATDEKRQRFEDAIQWLEGVAKGRIELLPVQETTEDITHAEDVIVTSNPRLFSRDGLRSF